jgi:hypothetical protein
MARGKQLDARGEVPEASSAPSFVLPKRDGALRGIREMLAVNPVMGPGSMSIPVVSIPGSPEFGRQPSFSYALAARK